MFLPPRGRRFPTGQHRQLRCFESVYTTQVTFYSLVILYLRPTFFHVTLPEASCLRFFRESSDWNEAETFVCHRGREMEAESAVHVTVLSSSFGYLVDFPSFAVSLLGVNSYKLIHLYTVC